MEETKQLLYKNKIKIFKDILNNIKNVSYKHYKKHKKLKKINTILKVIVNVLNAGSICSLVISYMGLSPVILISLSFTSMSSLLTAFLSSFEIDYKINSHNNSYLQYSEIYRHYNQLLIKNGLSSGDIDILLNEMNEKLNLIQDTELL